MTQLIIDPVNEITDYSRSLRELQIFWIFSIMVAGKRADVTAAKLTRMLETRPADELPFDYLQRLGPKRRLGWLLKHRAGPYKQISEALDDTLAFKHCLLTDDLHTLVLVRGVKYKTANFFMVHSREDYDGIVLDTHILKYLRDGGVKNVPKTTPQSRSSYEALEPHVRRLFAQDFPELDMAAADFTVWKRYHGQKNKA